MSDAPLVKICGLTREDDVDTAIAAGADLVGFVVVADSPRGVTLDRARELAAHAAGRALTVAVYAGSEPDSRDGFDLVQVYGLPADTQTQPMPNAGRRARNASASSMAPAVPGAVYPNAES